MSTQPPVRYENYPPDDNATLSGSPQGQSPVVRPYVPATLPPPPRGTGSSRRTAIGRVIGIPIAALVLGARATRAESAGGIDEDTSYIDESSDIESVGEEILIGDHSATAPQGWTVHDDGSGTVEVTNGANRLTAVLVETATSSLAVEEIAPLAAHHYLGFTGKIGEPVDRSTAALQHATMDGTGEFQGKSARLMAELWLYDTGTGLLITRVLTAKVSSSLSAEAQEMLDDLSGVF